MKKIDGRIKHQEDVIQTVLEFCKKFPDKKQEMADLYHVSLRSIQKWCKADNDKAIATKAKDIPLAIAVHNVMMQLHGDNLKMVVNELVRINNELAELKKDTSSELKTGILEHYQWCSNQFKPTNPEDLEDWIDYNGKMARLKIAVMDFCKWIDSKKGKTENI
jgi:hypothetical protein